MAVAPGTPVFRYVHLIELQHALRDRELRLTRIDQYPDPFEGSVPKASVDALQPIVSGTEMMRTMMESTVADRPDVTLPTRISEDPYELMAIRRKAAARSAHASCWTMAPETEPRWRLYCNDEKAPGQGVAMRTTHRRLEASVAHHDLIVRGVGYRLYHVGSAFADELAPFLHKRQGFQDEEEIRVLNYNETHQSQLAYAPTADGRCGPPPAPPPELPTHIFVGWNALDILDAIIVSPYATAQYEQRVRDTLAAIDPSAAPLITLSRFNARSADPLF